MSADPRTSMAAASAPAADPGAGPGMPWWRDPRSWLSPFAVLLYFYAGYLAVVYAGFDKYLYFELMNLGTRIIGFKPNALTLLVYAFGAMTLVLGLLLGVWAGRGVSSRPGALRTSTHEISVKSTEPRLRFYRRWSPLFAVGVVGWTAAMAANLSVIVLSGGVSILSIGSRWAQSPVLVLAAAFQAFFVPALLVGARSRGQRLFAALAFVFAAVALGLLGARNLPAKLVIATFLASVYVVKPRNLGRLAIVFLIVLIVAMGVIGAVSKSGIYGPTATVGLALALTQSDSTGSFYNLDRIVNTSPWYGVYGGKLLVDSFLSAVPKVKADYANYQLGRYLGGRSYFVVNGVRIDRSVSLAPTLVGAPYADLGVPGTALQMLFLGFVFGYLQQRARDLRWAIPFLVLFAAYVINGVNAGVHNPHAIIVSSLILLFIAVDLVWALLVRPDGAALAAAVRPSGA